VNAFGFVWLWAPLSVIYWLAAKAAIAYEEVSNQVDAKRLAASVSGNPSTVGVGPVRGNLRNHRTDQLSIRGNE
jgi:hypothetical protein